MTTEWEAMSTSKQFQPKSKKPRNQFPASSIKQRTKRGAAYPAMEGWVNKITACGTHGKKGTSSAKATRKMLKLATEGEHTHTGLAK